MYGGLTIKHIVAASKGRVIGRDGGMPWHLPEDFRFFKQTTMGKPMLMGRKTWSSIGKALPGRISIVISKNRDASYPSGVIAASSIEEGLNWCLSDRNSMGHEVFVVGGGEIYRQTLKWTDEIYLTEVQIDCEGDTLYPMLGSEFDCVEVFNSTEKSVIPFQIKHFKRAKLH